MHAEHTAYLRSVKPNRIQPDEWERKGKGRESLVTIQAGRYGHACVLLKAGTVHQSTAPYPMRLTTEAVTAEPSGNSPYYFESLFKIEVDVYGNDGCQIYGIYEQACYSIAGTGSNMRCGGTAPYRTKPPAWHCYSHLALDNQQEWSPVAGCTIPDLAAVYAACGGPPIPPPPPPPPPLPTQLRCANVIASGMVLQREPALPWISLPVLLF